MKDIVVYVKLPGHIRQWLAHSFGNPVRFPSHSYENAVLIRAVQIRPKNIPVPVPQPDEIPIVIPADNARDSMYYNYLGRRGLSAITYAISELFAMNLWSDLLCYVHNIRGINEVINDWCRDHGIDLNYREAVRQKFYRMRKAKEKFGINLGKAAVKKQSNGGRYAAKRYGTQLSLYDVLKENEAFEKDLDDDQ